MDVTETKDKNNWNNKKSDLFLNKSAESTLIDSNELNRSTISQLRIGVLGNVDSGKTTIISVLTYNSLDNGRGLARKRVLKHNHEKESGRTSSITHTYYQTSENILSFIDLAGHEKYYKTTIFGANSCSLDYIMILVGANMGVSLMTKEHFLLTLILKLPFIIVITKTDLAPKNILEQTINDIKKLIKRYKPDFKLKEIEDKNISDLNKKNTNNIIPFITVSNTNGNNINVLRNYLISLEVYNAWSELKTQSVYFTVEDVYLVHGVGVVITGTLTSGIVKKGDKLMIGPMNGNFIEIVVKSIHDNYKNFVNCLQAGESGCFCIKSIEKKIHLKRETINRGMIVLSKDNNNYTYKKFEAKIKILHHPTTIKKNYESIIHCGSIRQCAKIVSIENDLLRTGDQSLVTFQFKCKPEFIQVNKQIMFREGKTKGIGVVTRLITN